MRAGGVAIMTDVVTWTRAPTEHETTRWLVKRSGFTEVIILRGNDTWYVFRNNADGDIHETSGELSAQLIVLEMLGVEV
jgi:hypothetical protein